MPLQQDVGVVRGERGSSLSQTVLSARQLPGSRFAAALDEFRLLQRGRVTEVGGALPHARPLVAQVAGRSPRRARPTRRLASRSGAIEHGERIVRVLLAERLEVGRVGHVRDVDARDLARVMPQAQRE